MTHHRNYKIEIFRFLYLPSAIASLPPLRSASKKLGTIRLEEHRASFATATQRTDSVLHCSTRSEGNKQEYEEHEGEEPTSYTLRYKP